VSTTSPITLKVYRHDGSNFTPFTGNASFGNSQIWLYEHASNPIPTGTFGTNVRENNTTITFTNGNATINLTTQTAGGG